MENAKKKGWDSFFQISLGLNTLPVSCEIGSLFFAFIVDFKDLHFDLF
jgi:hypothetical protein